MSAPSFDPYDVDPTTAFLETSDVKLETLRCHRFARGACMKSVTFLFRIDGHMRKLNVWINEDPWAKLLELHGAEELCIEYRSEDGLEGCISSCGEMADFLEEHAEWRGTKVCARRRSAVKPLHSA